MCFVFVLCRQHGHRTARQYTDSDLHVHDSATPQRPLNAVISAVDQRPSHGVGQAVRHLPSPGPAASLRHLHAVEELVLRRGARRPGRSSHVQYARTAVREIASRLRQLQGQSSTFVVVLLIDRPVIDHLIDHWSIDQLGGPLT